MEIAKVEDRREVIKILKKYDLWENDDNWVHVGGKLGEEFDQNNNGIIAGQQESAVNALVEKLINAGDSSLLLKAHEEGIDPEGPDAPVSVRDAIEKFFGPIDGKWANETPKRRTEVGEKYCTLVATGATGTGANPTFTVIDSAQGQHPHDFEQTFLALTKANKTNTPFVQGKYGMGSWGAVNWCEDPDAFQLILSKRNPILVEDEENLWGFTIIRKKPAEGNHKSARWLYLVIEGKIPSFQRDSLDLRPSRESAYGNKFEFGSFIKLYNYNIGPSLRTNIKFDLYYKLNELLPNPVVPVRMMETRDGYSQASGNTTMSGLETRINPTKDHKSQVVHEDFPVDFSFFVKVKNEDDETTAEGNFKATIYVYKKWKDEDEKQLAETKTYGKGVLFTYNGQTSGSLKPVFFNQGGLKYDNIKNNILILIDASRLDNRSAEELFMPNRETLKKSEFTEKIMKKIAVELKNHKGLEKFQNEWQQRDLEAISDTKNYQEMWEKLFKDPNLAKGLEIGGQLPNPFPPVIVDDTGQFDPIENDPPTFFKLKKPSPKDHPRTAVINSNPRLSFVSDAPSDYFTRDQNPADFKIFSGEEEITSFDGVSLSGFKGDWQLGIPPMKKFLQGYRIQVETNSRIEPFESEFWLQMVEQTKSPVKKDPVNPRPKKSSPNLQPPQINEVRKENLNEYGMIDEDVLKIDETSKETIYDLNMDNPNVIQYMKTLNTGEKAVAKSEYKIAMGFIGLALKKAYNERKDKVSYNSEEDGSLSEYSKRYTKIMAPIIMTVIREISKVHKEK